MCIYLSIYLCIYLSLHTCIEHTSIRSYVAMSFNSARHTEPDVMVALQLHHPMLVGARGFPP